jgi:DNA-binding transcriptional ArsR family regulator
MVNYYTTAIDRTFSALANPVRRDILARLAQGAASIKELPRPFRMSLPGMLKHIRILEEAGLVQTRKKGRVKTCRLNAAPMLEAAEWLTFYNQYWTSRLDELKEYLEDPHK